MQGDFDGDGQENGLDGEKQQGGFNSVEQANDLDELVDGHWLGCNFINHAQSLLKKQFPQQNGKNDHDKSSCVQAQIGAFDCGLFAIAFAVALVNGQDPAALTFDHGHNEEAPLSLPAEKATGAISDNKDAEFQEEQSDWEGGCLCLCIGIRVIGQDACTSVVHAVSISSSHI